MDNFRHLLVLLIGFGVWNLVACGDTPSPLEHLSTAERAALVDHFVTEWTGTTVTIPTYSPSQVSQAPYLYDVDWDGDGTFDELSLSGDATHAYADNGPHTVRIRGDFPGIWMGSADCSGLREVKQWGTGEWRSFYQAFMDCENLSITAQDVPSLGGVATMERAFIKVVGFDASMGAWDVSNVQVMTGLFNNANTFNVDIGNWDTGNVVSMAQMFWNARSFNQDIGAWNTQNVTNMSSMFRDATAFNQNLTTAGSAWDVSGVTTMSDMFAGASSFNGDIGNWDTGNVSDMSRMFAGATAFNDDISAWNTGNVTTMRAQFANAAAFNQPIGAWDTSNVTTMYQMFNGASTFNQAIGGWDTSKVTNMARMFRDATAFDQNLNAGGGAWDVGSVMDMSSMFSGATAFNGSIGNWNTSAVTDTSSMFAGASSFDQDISGWDTGNVTTMVAMFQGASTFNQPIGAWNVGAVKTMVSMFYQATAFDQPLSTWNIAGVQTMANMLDYSGVSKANYDATLMEWAAQSPLEMNVTVGAVGLEFCKAAENRQLLIDNFQWTFQGDTLNCCGNNAVDPGELCDDGVNDGSDGSCSSDCKFFVTACYPDLDGDGYGDNTATPSLQSNTAPAVCTSAYVVDNTDCDDSSARSYPGNQASDVCDGLDQDCNGQTDEDFVSTTTSCGLGECAAAGSTSCVGGTVVDSCVPGPPAANDSICDYKDEDCDGEVDEDAIDCFYCAQATDCPTLPNPCDEYTCQAGICIQGYRAAGSPCDDGKFCTSVDTCDGAGSCTGAGATCSGSTPFCDEAQDACLECRGVADCPPATNVCQVAVCTAGACDFADRPLGTVCLSDNNACNGPEQCQGPQGSIECLPTGTGPCDPNGANPQCIDEGNDTYSCVGTCGDGKIGVGEACDLGAQNTDDPDIGGCSTTCQLNPGWECPGGATSCASPAPICGDGVVIGTREACDDGQANGSTDCGCNTQCTYPAQGAACDDGLFCNGGADRCDGAGACSVHVGPPCSLGAAACREDTDTCDECLTAQHCDDGLACNGAESCDIAQGVCAAGTPVTCSGDLVCDETDGTCGCPAGQAEVEPGVCAPIQCTSGTDCDDNDVCNGTETCNLATQQCEPGTPLSCDNGLACDGVERCNPLSGCGPGNPVSCATGFECVEPAGICEPLCGNGIVDPDEECDDGAGNSDTAADACRTNCRHAACGDGVVDTGEACDDGNQQIGDGCSASCMIEECQTVADCDAVSECETVVCTAGTCFYNDKSVGTACTSDGDFCTGVERCDGSGACVSAGNPCANPSKPLCDETLDECVACLVDNDCADALFCNGVETCTAAGVCAPGTPVVCDPGFACDPTENACVTLCGNGICDDGETLVSCPIDCGSSDPDTDLDGVPDARELALGMNPNDPDSDGDGVPDGVEVGNLAQPRDTDGDGVIDALDPDDDGDGLLTREEDLNENGDPLDDDTDGDGTPNFRDPDDDGDGVPTVIEAFGSVDPTQKALPAGLRDTDGDGIPDFLDVDDDNDTILTASEYTPGVDIWMLDTDGDGIPNYRDDDDDDDTVLTAVEVSRSVTDFDGDGVPDYLDDDDDGDTLLTADEVLSHNTDPLNPDTDDDGLLDGVEVKTYRTDPLNPDTDDDGLLDGEEISYRTDPLDPDTDDDDLLDGEEVKIHRTNPLNPDTDDDGLLDGEEVKTYRTDPLNPDTDGDGFLDGEEVRAQSDPLDSASVPTDPTTGRGGGGAGGCSSAPRTPVSSGLVILFLLCGVGRWRGRSWRRSARPSNHGNDASERPSADRLERDAKSGDTVQPVIVAPGDGTDSRCSLARPEENVGP